jgi:eukaryotic-like serine/threonine-protein kinase
MEPPTTPPTPAAPEPSGPEAAGGRTRTWLPGVAADRAEAPTLPPEGPPCPADGSSVPPGYELLGEVGRGGMGVVYRARDRRLGRVVALKMILAGGHASQAELARFLAEAEAVAQLHHPNIVQVYEGGQHQGLPYFTLEYVPGGSLAERLGGVPLPPAEAARLVEQLGRGVHYAHGKGVVHRDLKPANVLLTEDGTPKVTDFGLARRAGTGQGLTATGAVLGTPSYMAPEQAEGRGKEATAAADVYALGAILYECLTGRPPFRAATPLDTLLQVVGREPVPPRELNAQVPRDLETVCLKCLQKEPGKRYATAQDLADDLRRFRAGEPIRARPVGRAEKAVKWVRRNPVVAGLLGLVVLLTGAGLAGVGWQYAEAVGARRRAEGAAEAEREARQREAKERKTAERTARAEARARREAEQQRDRAERLVYAGQTALAQSAWNENNVPLAWEYLRATRPDLRGWEYDYLRTQFNRNQRTWPGGHPLGVKCLAFRPDGKRFLSCGAVDNTLKLWDVKTGKVVRRFKGFSGPPLAFTPDGKHFLSCKESLLKLVDAETGREVRTLGRHWEVPLALSPDGKRFLCATYDTKLLRFDGTLKVLEGETGREVCRLKGHKAMVTCAAFSPEGRRVASGDLGGTLKVWDAEKGREAWGVQHRMAFVKALAFRPDGKVLVGGSVDGALKVWDVGSGRAVHTLKGHAGQVNGVAFRPDGKVLVSGGSDRTLKVWDADKGQEVQTLKGHTADVDCLAFSPDGKWVLSGSRDGTLKFWDPEKGQEVPTLQGRAGEIRCLALSPDGKWLVSGGNDGALKLRRGETGEAIRAFSGHKGPVNCVAFSPDGKLLLSGGDDKTVKLWDVSRGQTLRTLGGHKFPVNCVAFSPDGKEIAGGSFGTLIVWDRATGRVVWSLEGHAQWVSCVAFSPDGKRVLSNVMGGGLKAWDAATGKELPQFLSKSPSASMAFSPDRKTIATGTADGTVQLLDAETGRTVRTFKGHTGPVPCVAFGPGGKRIVSGSADKNVKLWDVDTDQAVLTLRGHTGAVTSVVFSPDGRRIVTGSDDGALKLWEANRPEGP